MSGNFIGAPIRWFFGIMIGVPAFILIVQLCLVFHNYSVERLYLNKNMDIMMSKIEEYGGLHDYNNNGFSYSSAVTAVDVQAGTKTTLKDVYGEFEHTDPLGLAGGLGNTKYADDIDPSVAGTSMDFFNRTNYTIDVKYTNTAYVGSEVKLTIHRDIAFKLLWNIPWVIHLSQEDSYVHDTQYTPSEGYARESGAAWIAG